MWVSKIESVLSIIFHKIYGSACIQLTHLSYHDAVSDDALYVFLYSYQSFIFRKYDVFNIITQHWNRIGYWNSPTRDSWKIYDITLPIVILYVYLYLQAILVWLLQRQGCGVWTQIIQMYTLKYGTDTNQISCNWDHKNYNNYAGMYYIDICHKQGAM